MTTLAFTLGNTSSYDRDIREKPRDSDHKMGYRAATESEPVYEGGWVWRTSQEADHFRQMRMDDSYSVYELRLPTSWEVDVSHEPHASDGVHRLINDALIICKVNLVDS